MKTRWMMTALLGAAGMAQASFVTIGNAGNTADTTGYGAVAYTYQISATEVSIAEFQASGAGNGNENFWNDGTRTAGTAAPASQVSLYEAMKYCNWLTSGDINLGVYSFDGNGDYTGTDRASAIATYGEMTTFALPTEDEWYKAAYFKPDNSGYSLYANGTDTAPTIGGAETGWNYSTVNPYPNYIRDVALGTTEQNGTVNMMGNVWEWMETSSGVVRGGSCTSSAIGMSKWLVSTYLPSNEIGNYGFRVVIPGVIPEPATALSLVLGGLVVTGYRRIRKSYGL